MTLELAHVLLTEHPYAAAAVLEHHPISEVWEVFTDLEPEARPLLLEGFSEPFAAALLAYAPEEGGKLFRELPSDFSADLLPFLPEKLVDIWLEAIPKSRAEEIETLADYDEESAGSVMSAEFVALRQDATVSDALVRLRRLAAVNRNVSYVYVIDEEARLTGVLLMRDLVLAQPEVRLRNVMIENVVRVYVDEDIHDVSDVLQERRLLALPVVDRDERLQGVVLATQLTSELQEEGFEDAQKLFGAGADEHASSTQWFAVRKRLPWLSVNLVTAFLAAAVIGLFDSVIAQVTVLAALLPVVAGQGGNAGAQALAVTLRSLALDGLEPEASRSILSKEARVGLINGLATGVLAGGIATVLSGNLVLGGVITVAMVINLIVAGVAGAGIPLLLERLGQDPAQSANIVLTTVTDVIGFGSFLGLAVLVRAWLV